MLRDEQRTPARRRDRPLRRAQLRHARAAASSSTSGALRRAARHLACADDTLVDRRARDVHRRHRVAPTSRSALPMLAQASRLVGGAQIQNRGTIGGNIANASPAGDSLPVLRRRGRDRRAAQRRRRAARSVQRVLHRLSRDGAAAGRADRRDRSAAGRRQAVVPQGRHARGAGDLEDRDGGRARRRRRASRSAASRRRSFALPRPKRRSRRRHRSTTRSTCSSARSRRSTTCARPPTIGAALSVNLLRRFWSDTDADWRDARHPQPARRHARRRAAGVGSHRGRPHRRASAPWDDAPTDARRASTRATRS